MDADYADGTQIVQRSKTNFFKRSETLFSSAYLCVICVHLRPAFRFAEMLKRPPLTRARLWQAALHPPDRDRVLSTLDCHAAAQHILRRPVQLNRPRRDCPKRDEYATARINPPVRPVQRLTDAVHHRADSMLLDPVHFGQRYALARLPVAETSRVERNPLRHASDCIGDDVVA